MRAGLLLALLLGGAARAHDLGHTEVWVAFPEPGAYQVDLFVDPPDDLASPDAWLVSLLDRGPSQVELLFDGVRAGPRASLPDREDFTGEAPQVLRLEGSLPDRAQSFQWSSQPGTGPYLILLREAPGALPRTWFLDGGQVSEALPLTGVSEPPTAWRTGVRYAGLGFTHILPKGLDHIFFVLGLFLSCRQLRPLLVQVTAFTVAHSVTLALGLLGLVQVSGALVEPLIALSIVVVAVENLVFGEARPWRPALVFLAGLVHGLGFAGVLAELGLPPGQLAASLLGFNLGVELGQLAVVGMAFAAVGWAWSHPAYGRRVVRPGSVLLGAVGLFWALERVFG